MFLFFFFFQAEDGIRDYKVTGVQTCALPIWGKINGSIADDPSALLRGGLRYNNLIEVAIDRIAMSGAVSGIVLSDFLVGMVQKRERLDEASLIDLEKRSE